MLISNQVFTVIGLAASGKSATQELLKRKATVYIFDEDKQKRTLKTIENLVTKGAILAENVETAIEKSDIIVVSPGVPIDSSFLVHAKKMGKRIMGELELGFLLCKSPIIAITGTNGKTTTCSLVHHILSKAGLKSELVGNIGTPITERLDNLTENTLAVTEVSSFMLETINAFCPHIAVVLNITPDHLDRHYTMDNYVYLKRRILSNMRESEYAVLNFDDEIVRSFAQNLKAKVIWFSMKEKVGGAYLDGENLCYNGEPVCTVQDLNIAGEHNISNSLSAIAVAKLVGVASSEIKKAFTTFKGVKHRIELVYEKAGVRYYNDSKSTNVDSTIKAIDAMTQPTVIILGGRDKNQNYDPLFEKLKTSCVVHAVLMGENRYKLLSSANSVGFLRLSVSSSFESAIKIAKIEARNNASVLLSPASASFDMFSGYEERGRQFERIVKLINE